VLFVLYDLFGTCHRSHAIVKRNPCLDLFGFAHTNGVGSVVAGIGRASNVTNDTLEVVSFLAQVFLFVFSAGSVGMQ
jgi:hypothetical protein